MREGSLAGRLPWLAGELGRDLLAKAMAALHQAVVRRPYAVLVLSVGMIQHVKHNDNRDGQR